jgi:hypothetical protein
MGVLPSIRKQNTVTRKAEVWILWTCTAKAMDQDTALLRITMKLKGRELASGPFEAPC